MSMAISRKISKPKVEETQIEELIFKGGSSGQTETQQEPEEDIIKKVQLRISTNKIDKIDSLVNSRAGKVSRHTWIMEAIEEKLEKECS